MTDALTSSFSSRYLPWTKIGTVIDDESVNAAAAPRLGGIDFEVELQNAGYWQPTLDEDGNPDVNGAGEWVETPTRRAVVRKDTQEWFSYVSTDYRVVQYTEAFDFIDLINPKYVAAGALSNGRQGFMIVQLPESSSLIEVNGIEDPHEMYVVLQTSHDLSKGIHVAAMMLRGKCMNMLTLPALGSRVEQHWSIPHIGDPHVKLQRARETLEASTEYKQVFERMVQQLSSVAVEPEDLRSMVHRAFPKRLKTIDQQADQIVDKFVHAPTVGVGLNGWGAVNAVSDFMQWGRSTATRTAQSEFTSALEGDTAKYVNRIAQLVMARA
jgi:phage/plasmid-like protein (TIGR03299 family)